MSTSAVATIKLFGMLKTLVPGGELSLDFPVGCKVKDFIEILRAQWPEVAELVVQKKVLVSVNQEIAHWDTEISNSDEIALLPPFAGGSSGKVKLKVMV
jgi:molybdopterin converting factor small subunit